MAIVGRAIRQHQRIMARPYVPPPPRSVKELLSSINFDSLPAEFQMAAMAAVDQGIAEGNMVDDREAAGPIFV